jgi:16S rRNA (guanine527-N7)-methyltransferase
MNVIRLSNHEISAALGPYGIKPDDSVCDRIRAYIAILLKWNQKISLTTVTNPNEIIRFHFGESLFAGPTVPVSYGRLADVGSGAGFPGLALRLLFESMEVVLIESNAKKATFLSEVSRELNLKQVTVFRGRMDDYREGSANLDFVTARALGQHTELLKWSHRSLGPNGKLILWLGEADVKEVSNNLAWKWHDPVKIPQSQRRFLLIGSTAYPSTE